MVKCYFLGRDAMNIAASCRKLLNVMPHALVVPASNITDRSKWSVPHGTRKTTEKYYIIRQHYPSKETADRKWISSTSTTDLSAIFLK